VCAWSDGAVQSSAAQKPKAKSQKPKAKSQKPKARGIGVQKFLQRLFIDALSLLCDLGQRQRCER
jgi:hypothetical protein